jgi:hypothetical protein
VIEVVEDEGIIGIKIKIGGQILQIRPVLLKVLSIAIIIARVIIMKKSVILNKSMRLRGIEVEDIIKEEVEGACIQVIL